jgi:hypothetical protein
MTDTAVKTDALEAGVKSLAVVGDRLVKLATDERLDDDREVIGDVANAMTNVRTEVTAVSRKLDVVQRDSQQREYERDVARQQAKEAETREARSAADGRMMMQLMAAGCVALCLAIGLVARWWYRPADAVAAVVHQRMQVSTPPVPVGAVAPVAGTAAPPSMVEASGGASAPPQATGDYACAFGYGRHLNCPEDVRGVTGQHRSTKTYR